MLPVCRARMIVGFAKTPLDPAPVCIQTKLKLQYKFERLRYVAYWYSYIPACLAEKSLADCDSDQPDTTLRSFEASQQLSSIQQPSNQATPNQELQRRAGPLCLSPADSALTIDGVGFAAAGKRWQACNDVRVAWHGPGVMMRMMMQILQLTVRAALPRTTRTIVRRDTSDERSAPSLSDQRRRYSADAASDVTAAPSPASTPAASAPANPSSLRSG